MVDKKDDSSNKKELIADCDEYKVTLEYDESCNIPDDAVLSVVEIQKEDPWGRFSRVHWMMRVNPLEPSPRVHPRVHSQLKEIISYLIVGILTTVVSLGVYYGCVLTFLDPGQPVELQAANVISWVCAVTFAYIMNRKYVFESRRKDVGREALSFFAARLGTLAMDMGMMFVMVTLLSMNDKIAKLIVQVFIVVANYLFSKLFVFKVK